MINNNEIEWLTSFLVRPTNTMIGVLKQLFIAYLKDTHTFYTNEHTQIDPQKRWVWIRLKEDWAKRETLTAHVDTVSDYAAAPTLEEILIEGDILKLSTTAAPEVKCLGGDDRAGVAMLWSVVKELHKSGAKVNFNLFFPLGEERGTQGTREFLKTWKTAFKTTYMLGFDRRNDDVVAYNFGGEEFISEIERVFNKKRGYGSCSDISVFQTELKIPSVNVSVGFKDEHTRNESIDAAIWVKTRDNLLALMRDPYSRQYLAEQEWEDKTYPVYSGNSKWHWDDEDDYLGTKKETTKPTKKELEDEYELGYNDGWEEALKEVAKFPGNYLKDSSVLVAMAKLIVMYTQEQTEKEKPNDTETTRTKRSWFTFKRKGN